MSIEVEIKIIFFDLKIGKEKKQRNKSIYMLFNSG